MSKSQANTRSKILDEALKTFNERGIEYVGLRELAALLGIRVSNITYYFPTKDDLVYQLSLQLSRKNAETIVYRETLTMKGFLEDLHQVFKNHIEFRCLLLSFVHLMSRNPLVAAAYKETQSVRYTTIKKNIQQLSVSGYLKWPEDTGIDFLVSTLALISRFWISEAAISFRELKTEEQMAHYLNLVKQLLMPYATGKAKKEIQFFEI